jgi:F0F1-type ATP synthase membrane subunit b/b'
VSQPGFYVQVAIWSQVVSALLFFGVLVWLWVRFIQPAVLAAQDNSNKLIAEAERRRDDAKTALDVLGEEIGGAKHDAELIAARAAAQAEQEYAASVAEANEAGERSLRNAAAELGRARLAAADRLRVELLDRALAQARVDAERRVDAAVNATLVDRFVAGLEHEN